MPPLIRPARGDDAPQIIPILRQWAERRAAANPGLWGREARLEGLGEPSPGMLRLVAEHAGRIVGIAHGMLLPVPPIYAGALGQPGLMQDDCGVTGDAPEGTAPALLSAMESALRDAGAGALIGSSTQAGGWREVLAQHGYAPLTLFMGKAGLQAAEPLAPVRKATMEDVPGIVAASAASLARRAAIHPFWTPHAQADARFDGWMRHSLTLTDRDMFVAGQGAGFAIAQPVARLLVPPAHDIAGVGVIDDFCHPGFEDAGRADAARALLAAAEGALARRGFGAALVVCPADWAGKAAVIAAQGFGVAKLWMIRQPSPGRS